MYAQFTYLDGPRAGQVRAAARDYATIGRHPECDVQFGPDSELEVSVQHAAVFKQGGDFMIRDLGSTNGTFLAGKRVRGDRPLASGDILQFGPTGPRLEFSISTALPVTIRPEAPPAGAKGPGRPEIFAPKTRPTERLRAEAPARRGGLRWIAAVLLIGAAATAIGFKLQADRHRALAASRQRVLMARIQEIRARIELLKAPAPGVQVRLDDARRSLDALGASIMGTTIEAENEAAFGRRIAEDSAAHQVIIDAAGFDPIPAASPVAAALAVVVAEFADGVRTGTGIAVRSQGDTVLVLTAGSLVSDSAGGPRALVVIFNGHSLSHRASVVRGAGQDAAVLRTELHDGNPTAPLAETPAAGQPVAVASFPAALDSLGDWRTAGVRYRAATASVTTANSLVTYGFPVSLGTPLLSARGEVVGLITRAGPTFAPGATLRQLLTP